MSDNKSSIITTESKIVKEYNPDALRDWLPTSHDLYMFFSDPDVVSFLETCNYIMGLPEWDSVFEPLFKKYRNEYHNIEKKKITCMKWIERGYNKLNDKYKFPEEEFGFDIFQDELWNKFLDKFPKINK